VPLFSTEMWDVVSLSPPKCLRAGPGIREATLVLPWVPHVSPTCPGPGAPATCNASWSGGAAPNLPTSSFQPHGRISRWAVGCHEGGCHRVFLAQAHSGTRTCWMPITPGSQRESHQRACRDASCPSLGSSWAVNAQRTARATADRQQDRRGAPQQQIAAELQLKSENTIRCTGGASWRGWCRANIANAGPPECANN